MAMLSARLERKVGTKTEKGTTITDGLVSKVRADEDGLVIITENNVRIVQESIGDAITTALEECGLAGERFAKAATPVDTGRLRNSITHALIEGANTMILGTNVEYAPYIELGVKGRAGHHMLQKAVSEHKDFYARVFMKHLKGK